MRLASRENIFYGHPESFGNKNIKLQECTVIAIDFFVREARALFRRSSLKFGGVGIFDSEDRRLFPDLS
jgi:hypothetical protein